MTKFEAFTLADLLNGRPIQGGGDTWYVRIKAGPNRYISIDSTGLTEYKTDDPTGYDDGDTDKHLMNIEWDDAAKYLPDWNPSV